ncbi:MAG: hypothetical protein GQ535_06795 [Rhodobacteraceae bacterium]|nr:hypothetical protein [Paracoccaceae bacterium]
MDFYVVQQPPQFINAGMPYEVTTTSLGTAALLSYDASGTTWELPLDQQNIAAAYSNHVTASMNRITPMLIPATPSGLYAHWPIELTPHDNTPELANNTVLSPEPLGLSKPAYTDGIPEGNFGFTVPSYTPRDGWDLFCGVAIDDPKQGIILSNYVTPTPNSQIFCVPEAKYYVKSGSYRPGYVVEFSADRAALCDFTGGNTVCNVTYKKDGTFGVTKS